MKKLIGMFSILALIASTAVAQQGGEKECTQKERTHGKHRAMLEDIPDITDEQKASLKEVREQTKKDTKPLREKLRGIKEQLHSLNAVDEPDLAQINSLIDSKHQIEADLDKRKALSMVKMRSVLTPEQRKAFDAKREERRAQHQKMRKEHKEMKKAK